MTEATDKGGQSPAGVTTAGDQLRRARESRNLTIQQVAQALHLDPWILEALEQNRFKDVGAPVFVKGHLRKYASEVGLDEQALMEAYYRADDTPETPGLVTDTFTRPRTDQHGRWPVIVVSSLLALLIILVAFLWLRGGGLPVFSSPDNPDDTVDVASASEPPVIVNSARKATVTNDLDGINERREESGAARQGMAEKAAVTSGSSQSEAARADDPTSAAVASPSSVTQTEQDDGQVRVSITLQNDSWMEIYDARNRRLFFDLARAGATENVTGAPPLQVLLGNSDDARVRVNGDVWPIPAAARRGKTARFTIR